MGMAWSHWQANRAYLQGALLQAVSHLKNSQVYQQSVGHNLARKLTEALIQRAQRNMRNNDLSSAWRDLTSATDIARPDEQDHLSRHKTYLVELTIEMADSLLSVGKITQALSLVHEIQSRHISDWRSDRICRAAGLIQRADECAARGQIQRSNQYLSQAIKIRPDLALLQARYQGNECRKARLKKLSDQLAAAIRNSQPERADALCAEILTLAPNHESALKARRHLACPDPNLHKTTFRADRRATDGPRKDSRNRNTTKKNHRFLIWIDTVGGYLVCPNSSNMMGGAVPHANIEIPIMADLNRRHVKITLTDLGHMIHPLAHNSNVVLAGQRVLQPTLLNSGQIMELAKGVRIGYQKPDPLSRTAKLDLLSRHRTQPSCDAIILAHDTIRLGPDPTSHIHCPNWSQNVALYRSDKGWSFRCDQPYQLDGHKVLGTQPLKYHSKISGADFSMGLESVR